MRHRSKRGNKLIHQRQNNVRPRALRAHHLALLCGTSASRPKTHLEHEGVGKVVDVFRSAREVKELRQCTQRRPLGHLRSTVALRDLEPPAKLLTDGARRTCSFRKYSTAFTSCLVTFSMAFTRSASCRKHGAFQHHENRQRRTDVTLKHWRGKCSASAADRKAEFIRDAV